VAAVLLALAWFEFSGLGHYDPFYDTGVYLESARMIARGYAAYRRVFSSQPPLWLPLVRFSFFLAGESFFAGQLMVAAAGLVAVASVMAAVAQLQGRASALIAAVLITVAPTQLFWSHAVIAEGPSTAFAAAAMALAARYYRVHRPVWVVLASIAITCSILTKLFGVYSLPAVAMLVAAGSAAQAQGPRARLRMVARDMAIMLVTAGAVILLFATVRDPLLVWDQAVRFHLKARISDPELTPDALQYWRADVLLWAIAPFSLLGTLGGWAPAAVLVWLVCNLAGLFQQQPIFSHHLVTVIPAFAAATAIGLGRLWAWQLRWWSGARTPASRHLAAVSGAAVAMGLMALLLAQAYADHGLRRKMALRLQAAKSDKLAAAHLRRLTSANDYVLTDAPGIAFLANRDMPPGLTDTSFKRISTRYLSASRIIAECESFDVKAALLWTGRLRSMPDVMTWIRSRFPQRQSFGRHRELYFRSAGVTARDSEDQECGSEKTDLSIGLFNPKISVDVIKPQN
jgi:hypothetical protein